MYLLENLKFNISDLRIMYSNSENEIDKINYAIAIGVRALLFITLSLLFIFGLDRLFGADDIVMAMSIYFIFFSINKIGFGYKINHSIISLAVIFCIILVSPLAMQVANPIFSFIINFISIYLLLLLTSDKPERGNGTIFVFAYILLTGNFVSRKIFVERIFLCLTSFLICAFVLWLKHSDKHREIHALDVIKNIHIKTPKGQWQFQGALGISLLFFIGKFFDVNKFTWVGFACATLLTSYSIIHMKDKFRNKLAGEFFGMSFFCLTYSIIPQNYITVIGLTVMLISLLCKKYRNRTILSSFSAMSMAMSIYGINMTVSMRMFNCISGLIFGFLFLYIYEYAMEKLCFKEMEESNLDVV